MNKYNLFGIKYSATNYNEITDILTEHAKKKDSVGLTALAVHGLIECYYSEELRTKVNKINYIVPDGQPVKWALNLFHNANLKDRVYGPNVTLNLLESANKEKLSVYFYGSTENTLQAFIENVKTKFSDITIAGFHIDRFREATAEEDIADIEKINQSGAHIVLVGRGCPRQEKWVSDHLGKIDAVMLAVGAAFDFHAGKLKQAPSWMQKRGLEWLFRLIQEPKRLWKRYLFTNSTFIFLIVKNILFKTKEVQS